MQSYRSVCVFVEAVLYKRQICHFCVKKSCTLRFVYTTVGWKESYAVFLEVSAVSFLPFRLYSHKCPKWCCAAEVFTKWQTLNVQHKLTGEESSAELLRSGCWMAGCIWSQVKYICPVYSMMLPNQCARTDAMHVTRAVRYNQNLISDI